MQPTASFLINPDINFDEQAMEDALHGTIDEQRLDIIDATGMAVNRLAKLQAE